MSEYALCTNPKCRKVSHQFSFHIKGCPHCREKHVAHCWPRHPTIILNGLVKSYLDEIDKETTEPIDFVEQDIKEAQTQVSVILICVVGEALLDEAIFDLLSNKLYHICPK